jgi:co-chaperonin GroES (HSP10)
VSTDTARCTAIEDIVDPLWDQILVRRDEASERVSNTIIAPASATREPSPTSGTILRSGPGVSSLLSPGTKVLFPEMIGTRIGVEGEDDKSKDVILFSSSYVLGIVHAPAN